jgi:type VI secretion system secreted protein VgrG
MSETAPRQAKLSMSVASGDPLDARELTVHERMSSLFSVAVTAVSDNPEIDFEAVIGKEARFEAEVGLAGGVRTRVWTGICKGIRQQAVEPSGLSTYAIEMVPTLWLACERRNHRMFQLLSDVDIALKILSEWGIEPVQKLSGTYKKRKYRVQYGESDYAFLCRLLEDAGVSFYFSDASGESKLVLADAPENGDLRDPKIPFRDHPSAADREHVTALSVERQVRPGRYTMRDHDYRRPPSYKLLASVAGASGVEAQLESFHYAPGAFLFESDKGDPTPHADDKGRYRTDEGEASAMVQRRLDAHRSEAFSCSFASNAVDLAPGVVMGLRDHPRRDLGEDRRLLVVASELHGGVGRELVVQAEVRSADVPYRPVLSTPKPKVSGVESATVVGPVGDEIHTDEFGRVRVHFHWDRESRMDENSSCWIHVSQPWGGTGYGGVNLPRIGQEVIVDFLGGDPDRPIIVGRVYTNLQKVPYGLPENKTQSGWKSNSTNATGGYNELMFEDAAGKELLRMQAEKDLHKLVKNDEECVVGHDRSRTVQRNEDVMVGKNRTKQIVQNERVTIGQNQSIAVGVNRSVQVGSIDSTTVGNTHVVMITPPGEGGPERSASITMTDKKIVLDTGAGATITMDRDKITIEADDLVEIFGKKRGVNVHAPAAGGKANVITGDKFSVDCKSVSIAASDHLKIVSAKVDVFGTSTAHLTGGSEATVTGGGLANINGSVVNINGPGPFAARVGDAAPGVILTGSATVLIGTGPSAAAVSLSLALSLIDAKGKSNAVDVALIAEKLSKFPPDMLQTMVDQKTRVIACRDSVTDYRTDLKGVQPRGWPPGSTWDTVPGAYMADTNEVVIATRGHDTADGPHVPETGEGHGSSDLVLHESAHSIDEAAPGGRRSAGGDFNTARNGDLGTLDSYETQPGEAGQEENYAESAARYYGGDPSDAKNHPNLHKYWASDPLKPHP